MHKNRILVLMLITALLFGRTFLATSKALSQPIALGITSEDGHESDEAEETPAVNDENDKDHEENSRQSDEKSDEEDTDDIEDDDTQSNEDTEEENDENEEDIGKQSQEHDENNKTEEDKNSASSDNNEKDEEKENNDDNTSEETAEDDSDEKKDVEEEKENSGEGEKEVEDDTEVNKDKEKETEEDKGSDEKHIEDKENPEKEEKDEDEKDEDEDKDGVDDKKESEEEREIEVEEVEESSEVKSKIKTENMTNEFEIKFRSHEGVKIELEYKNETQIGKNETKAELELSVRFLAIVEYSDNDTSGSLTENDTIIQVIDLKELNYTRPKIANVTSTDGEKGYRFESIGTLDGFKFNITALIFPKYAMINNALVSPTETKITINITNFPFQAPKGASAIALQISAVSEMEIEEESEIKEGEIKVKSETAEGYFSWENWAFIDGSIDGSVRPVNSSLTKKGEGILINLCYPRGTSIIHDPKLGVGILTPILEYVFNLVTSELLIGTGITAATTTIIAIALTRIRKPLLSDVS